MKLGTKNCDVMCETAYLVKVRVRQQRERERETVGLHEARE